MVLVFDGGVLYCVADAVPVLLLRAGPPPSEGAVTGAGSGLPMFAATGLLLVMLLLPMVVLLVTPAFHRDVQ